MVRIAGARTFDHDEAIRLKAEGLKRSEIAEQLGVSEGAVQWALAQQMENYRAMCVRLPKDLKRALERNARAEHRSVNSQLIKILQAHLDWQWYEENEDLEAIFAHPVARHIKRAA